MLPGSTSRSTARLRHVLALALDAELVFDVFDVFVFVFAAGLVLAEVARLVFEDVAVLVAMPHQSAAGRPI
ncbi:MAG: hypothetical protein OES57_06115 [Acidimicrobiia bacterium]|nr:hypothetical protein [Acidimicrobiia bacterium]